MTYKQHLVKNFLSNDEIESLTYDNKTVIESDSGDLTLYNQRQLAQSIIDKISTHIGPIEVRKSHVYNLTQPYRLHCDAGFDGDAYYTVIVPLDDNPQGGLYVMDQWANHAYSIEKYFKQSKQPVLSLEEQKTLIHGFDETKTLPDWIYFAHLKQRTGFTIKEFIDYQYNTAIMIPSVHFHCSQNVKDFESNKSLAIFTRRK